MASKEDLDARMRAAQAFSHLFRNPLFHKNLLLVTETAESSEYTNVIVAGPAERIDHTVQRFVDSNELKASIASYADGEILLRVISRVLNPDPQIKIFDIYDDTTVFSWIEEENLHPAGIHVINGQSFMVGGNIYRENIEKLCGFTDN
jgi:hypothetical protein